MDITCVNAFKTLPAEKYVSKRCSLLAAEEDVGRYKFYVTK
jgi:hypothetical protein